MTPTPENDEGEHLNALQDENAALRLKLAEAEAERDAIDAEHNRLGVERDQLERSSHAALRAWEARWRATRAHFDNYDGTQPLVLDQLEREHPIPTEENDA